MNGLELSIALGQITPGRPRTQNPEHAVENRAVAFPLAATALRGKQAFNKIPVCVGDVVSACVFIHDRCIMASRSKRAIPNRVRIGIRQTEPRKKYKEPVDRMSSRDDVARHLLHQFS